MNLEQQRCGPRASESHPEVRASPGGVWRDTEGCGHDSLTLGLTTTFRFSSSLFL